MNSVEGFILAGGASSRMGRDKAALRLGGKTFVERAAAALFRITGEKISLVGNLPFDQKTINFSTGKFLELPVIADVQTKNSPAALIGLHAALARAEADWAAVAACDLPFVTGDLFARLASFLGDENADAVVPLQPDGRAQPLCALYRRAGCLKAAEAALGGENWSLQDFLRRINTIFVEFAEFADLPNSDRFFLNVNTPEDFLAAQKILRA